ncbi:uncharacterized protein LOC125067091 [Vanessa atalanta]|uniref:uncharacterized protein LOC125067091 n=1 Tax=Vanessa atalanta TaxID=42275 RepID=UPI001FCDE3BC|nr:uncharacterized protein LOC125067091 [Vanessa atalanta]
MTKRRNDEKISRYRRKLRKLQEKQRKRNRIVYSTSDSDQSDTKEKLMKEYTILENCSLLQAPTLNPEILAAIAETTRNRDKKVEAV